LKVALLRIVNASPLILLGKIGRLKLLDVGGREVVIPGTVYGEVEDPSNPGQLPGREPSLPPIRREDDVPVPPEVVRHALDPGESMVLALALSLAAAGEDVEVALDEKKGRRAARALGLRLMGTAGLLVVAKAEGRIERVTPLLDQLEQAGMYLGDALR
jgi:predicted nucleic acid-binding protein